MIGSSAELKLVTSKKDFVRLYQHFLERDKNSLDMEVKEQVVYFADNSTLDFYKQKGVAIRYRWSNRGLEVVVKKRGITKEEYKKLENRFGDCPEHTLKVDIDQISEKNRTFSCSFKYTMMGVHQSFAFYKSPQELLTEDQKKFLRMCSKDDLDDLRFLIPIQSKTFIFPCDHKEFTMISLEEWRMPRLFGNRFYEVTLKTSNYSKNTLDHFKNRCDDLDLPLQKHGQYKTQWLYEAYFGE